MRAPKTLAVVPAWIERHCIVPDGFRKGQPFRLYDYQLLYLANFYLVRGSVEFDEDNPVKAPAFVHRRGLLVGPQKLGKGPNIAAQICAEAVGPALFAGWADEDDGYACADHGCRCGWEFPYEPGEPMGMPWPTPLIQVTATSEEQTDNIYRPLQSMIRYGRLGDIMRVGEEFIRLPNDGRIDVVTSSAQSRLGNPVTFVAQDEVGIWTRRNRMLKVADTQYRSLAGMGGRASLTSNAWDPSEESVGQREYESNADDVYRQFIQPPKHLNYANRNHRKKIHSIVYPTDVLRENGGHVDPDAIEAEAADLLEKDPAQAERFFGNRLVTGQSKWMDEKSWSEQAAPNINVAEKEQVTVGFDGSLGSVKSRRKPDATCLGGSRVEDGHLFTVGIWEASKPDGDGLWTWEPPREAIDAALEEVFDRYDVVLMWGDPQHWQNDLGRWALRYGSDVVLERWTNSDQFMARELERLHSAILKGDVTHDGDAQATRHVLNAQRYVKRARGSSDPDGKHERVLVSKEHRNSPDKIDMVPTWTLAYAARAHVLDKGLHLKAKSASAPLLTHRVKAR